MSQKTIYFGSEVLKRLEGQFPDFSLELKYNTAFELLVATILAAQCTDKRVNSVTSTLFKVLIFPQDYLDIEPEKLEQMIRPTGFFKNKARLLKACCLELVQRFNGQVPSNIDDLTALPGVGRKTANIILAHAFKVPAIAVDTHVKRVAQRLQLSGHDDPDKIEDDLNEIFPYENWIKASSLLVLHGRYTCTAKKPGCVGCVLVDICEWEEKQ